MRRNLCRGLTFAELITSIAVLGIVLGIGAPTFSLLKSQVRSRSASFLLSSSLAGARLEAANRRVPVSVCPWQIPGRCRSDGVWDQGWMLFLDPDRNGQPETPGQILRSDSPGGGAVIRSAPSRGQTRFLPDGRASGSNLTLRICSGHAGVENTRLVLSNAGRIRIEREPAGTPGCPGA